MGCLTNFGWSMLAIGTDHPSLVLFVSVVLLVLMWVRYVQSHYTVFAQMGIPGPRPAFLMGNSMAFAHKFPLDVFKEWANTYGKVFGFYEGLRPSIVVSCPDLAYKILVKHFNQFATRPVINPFMHEHQALSLQNATGQLWKRQRQAVNAGMTSHSLREMFPTMCKVTEQLTACIDQMMTSSSTEVFVDDLLERYSLDWFAQAALGYHSDGLTNTNNILLCYMRASHHSMTPENTITGLAKLFPALTCFLKPLDRYHRKMSRLQTRDVTRFVRTCQEELSKAGQDMTRNILYHLLTKRVSVMCFTNHKSHLTTPTSNDVTNTARKSLLEENEVIGEVSGLLGGGVGPFSSALAFCLYCLAVYPHEQARLWEELQAVTQSKSCITQEELSKLAAMDRFIQETLRLYPVAPGVSRECVEPCEIDGIQFKPGTVVRVMASNMYCREEFFPDPTRFNPDRFISPSHGRAWLPFGLGPRMCVGQRLAMLALKLALARLLQNYVISTTDLTQIPLSVALRPFLVSRDGIHVKFVARPERDVIC